MSILPAHHALAVVLLMSGAACATTSSLSDFDKPDFPEVIERYKTLPGEKFLALATEANGRFAWGIAENEASEVDARSLALERCRRAARSGGMRSDCHGFAAGDDPAPDTVEGCAARRITSRRCHMQRKHQGMLRR